MNKLTTTYQTIKQILTIVPTYYIEYEHSFTLLVIGDENMVICCIHDSTDINDFNNNYKAKAIPVASQDDALVLGLIANGVPFVNPRLPDGRVKIVAEKTSASTLTIYSSNWCDKTTWYEQSVRITENATNSGDNIHYSLSHQYVIDNYHGKYTNEDFILDTDGYSYRVGVSVNGVLKTEQDPHVNSGGDYTINYKDGIITFLTALDPADTVSVTYHYATTSVFTIKPPPGNQLKFGAVEVQFSQDIELTDSVVFQPYGFVEVFAPQYCTINGGPYPVGTKIPLGNPLIYKTIQDYLNDSRGTYVSYPALGGNGWRSSASPSLIFCWNYEGDKVLRSDYGMEIRLFLQHDTPFGSSSSCGTCTFYCKIEPL